ncbi:hypothetical protein F2Z80_05480 [Vibrio fortis]|uniref:Uncharacterized protein n=1 Tax=Vibrio fortis TaxID=212667 RepID=A0A5N3SBZ0_9VIBR|nr:hypothetical protein F2Z80_05480 [Vibrio fortis]
MASNFFKNVAKMQVVGALGLYLQTFVQNSSKVLVVCRTNTKKAPRKAVSYTEIPKLQLRDFF